MGAMNITLDKKTMDLLASMSDDLGGHEVHRRRTIENVANLAISSQIQLILHPDGAGDSIGGGRPETVLVGGGAEVEGVRTDMLAHCSQMGNWSAMLA